MHFVDPDGFLTGGALSGLEDGETVVFPWVRPLTAEEFAQGTPVGWYSADLYCRNPRLVRLIGGECITSGDGFFFAVRPSEVFLERPSEQRSYTDRDKLARLG